MPELLNHGIYDPTEVSRLLRLDPETLARWSTRWRRQEPLVAPTFGDIFSFYDLISLAVVRELWQRGVPRDEIHRGIEMLSRDFGTDRPFAHRRLATVGRSFFAELDEWVDAGKGGQGVFQVL
ncbi:MAG: hypothetical protein JOZ68_02725, partial [Acidimicrobiia bacterium]|nr:hypothetical protein [Acidimicrobiia bacterium]